ncbi:hypothetical protein [Thermofilum pendens]
MSTVVTPANILELKGTLAYWFAEKALELLASTNMEGFVSNPSVYAQQVATQLDALVAKRSKKTPSEVRVPLPILGNDARRKEVSNMFNLGWVSSTLRDPQSFSGAKGYVLSTLLLDLKAYLRLFGLPRTDRGKVLKLAPGIIALSLAGAYATHSYKVARGENIEYGYIGLSFMKGSAGINVVDLRKSHEYVRRAVWNLTRNEYGFAPIIVSMAAGTARKGILSARIPFYVEFLRIQPTGQSALVKGFDVVDPERLARLVARARATFCLKRLLAEAPSRERCNNLHRYINLLCKSLVDFEHYRRSEDLYYALRLLTSKELNREGAAVFKEEWPRIVECLRGLERLA